MIGAGYSPWFVDELRRRVEADRTEHARQLAQGIAPDYGAYQYGCGVIEGLRLALVQAEDLVKEQDQR